MEKDKKSTQNWLPFEEFFEQGIVKINSKKYIKIIEVKPINFNLKTDLEKEGILNSYKIFLKTCNFNLQILIQSNKEDLSNIISKIKEKNRKEEEPSMLKAISNAYIEYINSKNQENKSSSKNYYIIIENEIIPMQDANHYRLARDELNEKFLKVKENLARCGNKVLECSKSDVQRILFSFLNSRIYLNQK